MFFKHLRYALRTLPSYLKKSWLYTSLGLLSVSFIIIFQDAIDQKVQKDGQSLLSADIEISTRGKLDKSFESYILSIRDEVKSTQEVIDLNTMIRSQEGSLLVSVNGVENSYPFYNPELKEFFKNKLDKNKSMVLSQEASDRLNLKIGDDAFLGGKNYRVTAILKPKNATFQFSAFLPNIYINKSDLLSSGLIGPLSAEERELLIQLKEPDRVEEIEKTLKNNISNTAIRIKTFKQNNDRSARVLERLNQFISIIAIICLLYAFIGCLYSFRQYLLENMSNILIWKSLGYSYVYIRSIWLFKIFIISLCLFLLVFLFQALTLVGLLFSGGFLDNYNIELNLYSISFTFFLCLFFHLAVFYTYSSNLRTIKGLSLLRGGILDNKLSVNKFILILTFLFLYGISFYLSNSFLITNLFMGGIILSIMGLWLAYRLLIFLLSFLKKYFILKYIYYVFSRNQITFLAIFFSIIIGITVSQLIPFLSINIQKQLSIGDKPSLFFFDIQQDQVNNFQLYLKENYDLNLSYLSPMIRARLISINEEKVLDSTFLDIDSEEKENRSRFRNRAFNLSYRKELSDSEEIIKGKPLATYKGENIPVSLEKRFSTRTGMGIGDILEFDIFGQQIKAEVYNIRSINWFHFQPNFFVQFGDGVLNDFPKTYLATVKDLSREDKRSLQFNVNKKFNNIASVDLDLVIERVRVLVDDFQKILSVLSYFALFIGFLVFFAIYGHFIQSREIEIRNLKILGATKQSLRNLFLSELLILYIFCAFFGFISSMLMSRYIIESVFLFPWSFVWKESLFILLIYFIFMLTCFLFYYYKFFNKSNQDLLRK